MSSIGLVVSEKMFENIDRLRTDGQWTQESLVYYKLTRSLCSGELKINHVVREL